MRFILSFSVVLFFLIQISPAHGQNQTTITLNKSYQIALNNNEPIQISREKMKEDKQNIAIASSNLYPQLTTKIQHIRQKEFSLSYGGTAVPEDFNLWTINLNQHVYQLGKVWSGKRMAEFSFLSSRFRHIRQVQEILFQVSHRYYNVLLAKRAVEIATNALQRAERQLKRAQGRFEVGVVTRTDVLRAEVQVAQAQEQLENAKNQHHIALEELAMELGINTIPKDIGQPPERQFEKTSMHELYNKGLKHRQDLLQARKQIQAALEQVHSEKADFFPNISVAGQYMRTDESALYYGDYDDWRFSLNLSYSLFTGGERRASLEQARAQFRQAMTSLERLKREIRTQIRTIALNIETQERVIAQLKTQVESSKMNYRQITAQFEEGVATAVDQVDAFTTLNEAENRLAQAYYTYQLEIIRLELALGTFQMDLIKNETS